MLIGIDASRAVRARRTGTEAYSLHLIRALIQANANHRLRLYMPIEPPPDVWSWQVLSDANRAPETRSYSPCLAPEARVPTPELEVRVIPFPRLWTHVRLAWELRQKPPDVLFVPAHVIPLACPTPAVVTVHDLGYLVYPEAHRPFERWYLDWTTRRHARLATGIIADSQATRADLIEQYGADPERIAVIYPGRDESLARVDDPARLAEVKRRYGIAENADYLLYVGTLQPRKNLGRLVEAFARLQPQAANLQLVLVGKRGRFFDKLFARVRALELSQQVLFPGYVDERDKAALISGALAVVYPSLYEGFGLPVLEAMACGTPVLTSTVSSLPEVAGEAALLVNPLDTEAIAAGMYRLIAEADLRRCLIERGSMQVVKFSWASAARQLLEVLETVAADH